MPLKWFKCLECGHEFRTKQTNPIHCFESDCEEILTVPMVKYMEKQDQEKGKSAMINQEKILRERARKHSRDNSMHDLTQTNEKYLAEQNGWVKKDGTVRKAIDDK